MIEAMAGDHPGRPVAATVLVPRALSVAGMEAALRVRLARTAFADLRLVLVPHDGPVRVLALDFRRSVPGGPP